ncbi:MAG: methylmalonyl-CoA mutase [Deltaproteobacteria bacterium]|nr:methylmalonyl-CoA mutase [Deltaproteobacteria bacterium]
MEKTLKTDDRFFEKASRHMTWSDIPVKAMYGPEDVKSLSYEEDINHPGEFPFTRGIFSDMYRGRLWSMRELCGYASPAATNQRLRYLIAEGQSALNVIGDLPTQYGIDSDHPCAEGEVGLEGVPIDSIRDMEVMMEGIDLEATSINLSNYLCPFMALYLAAAERRGFDFTKLRGTFLNDTLVHILTLYYPKTVLPFDIGRRMTVDTIIYCREHVPRYYTITQGSEGLRESGATAVQEIVFDFCVARYWLKSILERGEGRIRIEDVAPRFGFTHRVGIDIFEEACKFRAARRLWARVMKEDFGTTDRKSATYKVHTPTLGVQLQRPQVVNNIVRIAYQSLAAVLGGVQSIHTMGFDEPVALPTEETHRLALRTQQILCYETGVVNVADPLGGSYYVESLTNQLYEQMSRMMEDYKDTIADRILNGDLQRLLQNQAYKFQKEVESGERPIVGVNCFTISEDQETGEKAHRIPQQEVREHLENLKEFKRKRDVKKVARSLENVMRAGENKNENLFGHVLEAARSEATFGEMIGAIRMGHGAPYDPFDEIEYPF